MEPQLPQVNVSPEDQPVPSVAPEQSIGAKNTTEAPIKTPEVANNTEKLSMDNAGQVVPPIASTTQTQDNTQLQNQVNDEEIDPAVAVDGDVIEKEWITKAKQIVSKTADDPYKQQDEVSKLMTDYIFKRFGRKIGDSNG